MRTAIIALTNGGRKLATTLAAGLDGGVIVGAEGGVAHTLHRCWQQCEGIVCIMAAGIVVRSIAPLLKDKHTDPAVVVVDEQGRYAVSLLSGHLGGGNGLATAVAALTKGQPVITTASDVLGLPALDLWAAAQGLKPVDPEMLTKASAILVNRKRLRVFSEVAVEGLPPPLISVDCPEEADVIISVRRSWPDKTLQFCPQSLVVGVGCNRGVAVEEIEEALAELLTRENLLEQGIRNIASIDLKKDEAGLLAFAGKHGWTVDFFGNNALNGVQGVTSSDVVRKATGAIGVAEPAALLSAGSEELLVGKRKWQNVTMAIARANFTLSAPDRERPGI